MKGWRLLSPHFMYSIRLNSSFWSWHDCNIFHWVVQPPPVVLFLVMFGRDILLMEEILHHLGCIKPCKYRDKLPTSSSQDFFHQPSSELTYPYDQVMLSKEVLQSCNTVEEALPHKNLAATKYIHTYTSTIYILCTYYEYVYVDLYRYYYM